MPGVVNVYGVSGWLTWICVAKVQFGEFEATLCGTSGLVKVQVTVSPGWICTSCGSKFSSPLPAWISTASTR